MSKRLNPAKLICMALAKNELAGKQPPRSPAQGPTPWGYARALLWGPCAPRWGLPRPPTLYPNQPTLYPAPNTAPGSPTLYPASQTLPQPAYPIPRPQYRPGLAHPIPRLPNAAPTRLPYTLPRYHIVNRPSTLLYYT
jgi:hypothetical protein